MAVANWTFFRAFLKAPMTVASVIPSSSFLERRVIREAGIADAKVVVEFGAGTGGITRAMLAAMRPDARLLAIEWTADFIPGLERIDDGRFEVVNECASTVRERLSERGLSGADAIVSGIPFSTMPPELSEEIAHAIRDALNPGGRFVAYQFSGRVADYLRPVMGEPEVQHEILNIPPLRTFTWRKDGENLTDRHPQQATS